MFNGEWKDSFSHVELEFENGLIFSASQYQNTTRFVTRNMQSTAWVEIPLNITYAEELKMKQFCIRHNNAKYDYLGILGFVLGNRDDSGKWFCSEICTEALKNVGIATGVNSAKVSPNGLYTILKEEGYSNI